MLAKTEERWLKANEAAARLNVSTHALRNWAEKGLIKYRKSAGGQRQYPESEVRRLERAND